MRDLSSLSNHQRLSYLAGMLDHNSKVEIKQQIQYHKTHIKIRLHVRSKSRQQILAFKRLFGGEIHQHDDHTYVIRYQTKRFREIVAVVGSRLALQRVRFFDAMTRVHSLPPNVLDIDIDYYMAGAMEAKGSFLAAIDRTRAYPTFLFTFYSKAESDYLGVPFDLPKNSVCWTWAKAKAQLQRMRPFLLDYECYHSCIHSKVNPPLDTSILSSKDAAFYETEQEKLKEVKEQERQAAIKAKRQAKERAAAEKEMCKRISQEQREGQLTDARVARGLARGFETDQKTLITAVADHDLWWTVTHRDKKSCRLCKQVLLLSQYDKGNSLDGLKHECKKCAYERYVKPRAVEMAARSRAWQKAHPEQTRAIRRKQNQKPHVKMRRRLVQRLKALIGSKSERYATLIGCSPKELVAHLESLFQPGMSWSNMGKWHIDHKIPCRAFDLFKKEERLKCFHHSNLQPLWAADNCRKSDSMPDGTKARAD